MSLEVEEAKVRLPVEASLAELGLPCYQAQFPNWPQRARKHACENLPAPLNFQRRPCYCDFASLADFPALDEPAAFAGMGARTAGKVVAFAAAKEMVEARLGVAAFVEEEVVVAQEGWIALVVEEQTLAGPREQQLDLLPLPPH